MLAALALIADLAIERLAPQAGVPAISGSRTMTRFALAVASALFVVLKFLFHIHFSLFGIGCWAAVVLSAGLVVLATRARRDESLSAARQAVTGPVPTTPPSA